MIAPAPIRESIARTLFGLFLALLRCTWSILPHRHPVRIFLDARAEQVEPDVNEALSRPWFWVVAVLTILGLLAALAGIDIISDELNANPLEHVFNL